MFDKSSTSQVIDNQHDTPKKTKCSLSVQGKKAFWSCFSGQRFIEHLVDLQNKHTQLQTAREQPRFFIDIAQEGCHHMFFRACSGFSHRKKWLNYGLSHIALAMLLKKDKNYPKMI